jgi:hypothetical protein
MARVPYPKVKVTPARFTNKPRGAAAKGETRAPEYLKVAIAMVLFVAILVGSYLFVIMPTPPQRRRDTRDAEQQQPAPTIGSGSFGAPAFSCPVSPAHRGVRDAGSTPGLLGIGE